MEAPSLQHPCKMWQSRRLCPPQAQHAVTKKVDLRTGKSAMLQCWDAAAALWGCQHGQKVDSTTKAAIRRTWRHVWKYIRVRSFVCGCEDCLPPTAGLQESEVRGRNQICVERCWSIGKSLVLLAMKNKRDVWSLIESSDAIYLVHHPNLFRNLQ